MAAHELKEALETLKETGVRITPQRHAILEYLVNSMAHPTADDIYKALEGKFPNMSVATVYNNLRVFRESGLVKELTYGDASSRFDFVIPCPECKYCFNEKRLDTAQQNADQTLKMIQHPTLGQTIDVNEIN